MIELNYGQFVAIVTGFLILLQELVGSSSEISSRVFALLGLLILYYVARLTETLEDAVEGDPE